MNSRNTSISCAWRKKLAAFAATVLCAAGIQAQTVDTALTRNDVTSLESSSMDLISLVPGGQATAVKLTGSSNVQYFDFGVRTDEIVSQALLELEFTPSASLLAGTSQINIYLNGVLQKSTALAKDAPGKLNRIEVTLDPKVVKPRANQLSIELIGHYQIVCESEANPSIWLDIAPSSRLTLSKHRLRLPNDLSQLPMPFVDTAANTASVVPMVFDSAPDSTTKQAAAIFAGSVGAASGWRGAHFPVYYDEIPAEGHFIVFATNTSRPAFLKNLPAFTGPEIIMADAPGGLFEKMLVVGGRDSADLVTAAQAAVSSSRMWIGPKVSVADFKTPEKLAAYVSPNWVALSDVVPLSHLMQYPEQLTARGKTLPAVHVALRLPPDAYATNGAQARVSLLYRHSKPAAGQSAQLRTSVNGYLADSENLTDTSGHGSKDVSLPLAPGALTPTDKPRQGMAAVNDLSFEGMYTVASAEGTPDNCRTTTLAGHQLQIDASSMIELDGIYHYAKLPEIAYFMQGGFPFTKFADLSETAAVIERDAQPAAVTTLLNAVGRMSAASGVAPVHLTVVEPNAVAAVKNKDLLIVDDMPADVTQINPDAARSLEHHVGNIISGSKPLTTKPAQALKEPVVFSTAGFAAIVSVPATTGTDRTAVALLTEGSRGAYLLNQRLAKPADLSTAHGGTVFLSEDNVTGFAPASTYTVGNLPWLRQVWDSFADRPFLMVLFALLAAVTVGGALFLYMRRWIRERGASSH